jgi:hypothetical protein
MKIFFFVIVLMLSGAALPAQPVRLHSENPHYFFFKGKPTLLISSAEHYGAVLNLDIDYKAYLHVLAKNSFNHTRLFSGAYCEGNESEFLSNRTIQWKDVQNTLSPRPGKFIAPWARSNQAGYKNGGNKFDLDKWDDAYFHRLKDFCTIAQQNGIVVEMVLFTAIYNNEFWMNSPLNPINNINNTEALSYNAFHLLKNKKLIARQLDMVAKIVEELNEFDNIYFEICNEPYWLKGIPESDKKIKEQQFLPEINEWQALIAKQITATENRLPKRHLVAQNIANTYYKIKEVLPGVSVLNFHYAFPPTAVTDNYHLELPVAFDETADGQNAANRRKEAWAFILAGGAVYSNLDFSYTIDDPSGSGRNTDSKRMNGKEVKEQLRILKNTMDNFDYIHAGPVPANEFNIPSCLKMQGLKIAGKAYLCYFYKENKTAADRLSFILRKGKYTLLFIDPADGKIISQKQVNQKQNGLFSTDFPLFSNDIVMKIVKNK